MKILVVEDDNSIAQAVAATLAQQQHCLVDIALDGQEGWELATAFSYDLILLDVMLPKLDGMSLCRQLRQKGDRIPILMLTAKDSSSDKVVGLDAGADDYVVKPFDFAELIARVRALLRRGSAALPPVLEWGELRLDPSNCEATYGQQVLQLTPKEYALLELFLRNPRRTFSRSAIVDRLWDLEDPPQEDTIKSYIKSLRHKLKTVGAPCDLIETVYGLGYRLKPLESKSSHPQATASDLSEMQQEVLSVVVKFREVFTAGIGDRLAVLEQAVEALCRGKLDDTLQKQAVREAHKLAGALGSFGFAPASHLAQEMECLLEAKNSARSTSCLRLCQLLEELEKQIQQPPDKADLGKLFLN
ncbi:response regulator [Chroococcidiopsis sp. SAG 2025]|uniref:response regulator n=1 Tax=Chroococcidiopsis sp. SAG 2025 TaxID=171389 RepID=UPI0029371954|nr:response regulator [Chroococcidiopsis sp. SAG 2025]